MAAPRGSSKAPGARRRTPREAARDAKRQVARLGRPGGDFDASRYFRAADDLAFYNVGTSAMRALARSIHAANRGHWSSRDATLFADTLIKNRYLEVKLSANHSANWATTDARLRLAHRPVAGHLPAAWRVDAHLGARSQHVGTTGGSRGPHPFRPARARARSGLRDRAAAACRRRRSDSESGRLATARSAEDRSATPRVLPARAGCRHPAHDGTLRDRTVSGTEAPGVAGSDATIS